MRAAELADQITRNAVAREVLAGQDVMGHITRMKYRPENIARHAKATGSSALLKVLNTLKNNKIL